MLITSIDVGFNNLALAVVEGTKNKNVESGATLRLNHLMLVSFETDNLCEIADLIISRLDDDILHNVDEVIIEQQYHGASKFGKASSSQNTKMMMLSHMLLQFFAHKKKLKNRETIVKFVGAQSKFRLCTFPTSRVEYKIYKSAKETRKEISRKIGSAFLKEFEEPKYTEFLGKLDKTDDVCDSYIQGRAYLEKELCIPKFYKIHVAKWDTKTKSLKNCPSNIMPVELTRKRKKKDEEGDDSPIKIPKVHLTEEERAAKLQMWECLSKNPAVSEI